MLELLSRRKANEIEVRSGPTDCKQVYSTTDGVEDWRAERVELYKMEPTTHVGGLAVFCHEFSWQNYEWIKEYGDWIETRIAERDLLYLHLFPLSVGGETEVEFIEAAKQAFSALR